MTSRKRATPDLKPTGKGRFRHLNLPTIAEKEEQFRLYNNYNWTRSRGEVLAPSGEGQETLDNINADIGEAAFRTQYQQDHGSAGSVMLDFTKIAVLDYEGSGIRRPKTVQVWDTAVKDGPNCDFLAGITFAWDYEKWVVFDVITRRMNFGGLKTFARSTADKWKPVLVLVEDSANGSAFVHDMR
ncbi:hypothetical protein OAN307_c07500 [Octadecabacter antarcticus 307]|uniref:Terminase large subunit gp17-like C-terminal domain-containing protein n=1 Tax=Octadecabacter antarcticus 307 TaxID=391626 RepID=M9R9S9_9RHOB|nr:hypothetical protein OAN307_c07500 [Octadecabacter antarcticus 307]